MINYKDIINQNVRAASDRIREHIRRTPFERSAMISDLTLLPSLILIVKPFGK